MTLPAAITVISSNVKQRSSRYRKAALVNFQLSSALAFALRDPLGALRLVTHHLIANLSAGPAVGVHRLVADLSSRYAVGVHGLVAGLRGGSPIRIHRLVANLGRCGAIAIHRLVSDFRRRTSVGIAPLVAHLGIANLGMYCTTET